MNAKSREINSLPVRRGFRRSLSPPARFPLMFGIAFATILLLPATLIGQSTDDQFVEVVEAGKRIPIASLIEMEEFLRQGEIVGSARIPIGLNQPDKVVLEYKGIRNSACFRDVKISKKRVQLASGKVALNFRDDAIFEVAAYELSKVLGLSNIPPAVPRRIRGRKGTLQAWIEGAMMEGERLQQGLQAPDPWDFQMQYQVMRVFDNLIHNDDRNSQNLLIDQDWKIWLIDHTRSFRLTSKLYQPDTIRYCPQELFEAIKKLEKKQLQSVLGEYITKSQIDYLLKRRDALVELIGKLASEHGQENVLVNFSLARMSELPEQSYQVQ